MVLPQPAQPEQPVALQDMITQGDLLGLPALTGIEEAEDVQDREHQGDHGQLNPDDLVPAMGE